MKTISFDFLNNLGGINKIYAIPPALLDSITHNYTENKSYLNLSSNEDIIEIYCTMDTIQYQEKLEQSSAGGIYSIEISGVIPKSTMNNQEKIQKLENQYWLVLFEDNNGNVRLAGDTECYLVFQKNETTGKTMVARNQIDFEFVGSQTHPCYFIHKTFISAY